MQFVGVQTGTVALRQRETRQQAQQSVHLVAVRQALLFRLPAKGAQRRREGSAQQHRHPGQVDPDQEDRDDSQGAIDLRV